MDNNLFWATAYPIIALVLMIMGFVRDPLYFYGAVIVGFVAYYWISKAWKSNKKKHKRKSNKGWKRCNNTPKWAKDTLFKKVNKTGDVAYAKGKHYLYKVIMRPDFQSSKFDFDFYKKRRNYGKK